MKIRVIIPNTSNEFLAHRRKELSEFEDVEVTNFGRGPSSVECFWDEALASAEMVHAIVDAEKDGCDAAVIDCFCDPGIQAARELVSIPVVGAGESSMLIAMCVGENIGIVTAVPNYISSAKHYVRILGLHEHIRHFDSISIPVLELHDFERTVERLVKKSQKWAENEGVDTIILGCTGMSGVAQAVQNELYRQRIPMPVIDAGICGVRWARLMLDLQLRPNRLRYMHPPEKERTYAEARTL